MILIISDSIERSTTDVTNWLSYFKVKFLRVNFEDRITIHKINIFKKEVEAIFSINGGPCISTNEINSYWYRRGAFSFPINTDSLDYIKNSSIRNAIKDNLFNEYKTMKEFIYFIVENKKNKIGSFYTKENNKLIHLSIASKIGLQVPDTIVCSNKKDLLQFYNQQNRNIIIKAIGDSFTYIQNEKNKNKQNLVSYTHLLSEIEFNGIPEEFPLTLFQNNIEKMCELRIFYIQKKFFAMAIFSQNDNLTKTDFRRYNLDKQNRRIPFLLPNGIKKKIILFMKINKLETGSIDMIYTNSGEYIFLEVNPVGQFGMVSDPCNYKLEKIIAQTLIQ